MSTLLWIAASASFALSSNEGVECVARWGPVESSVYPQVRKAKAVRAIFEAGAVTPKTTHDSASLRALLPADPTAAKDGDVWEIDVEKVLPFLKQLHPGVTPRMRHARPPERLAEILRAQGDDPAKWPARSIEGGRATWIARSDAKLELLLRVHVEFVLEEEHMVFLPSQFEGHLVWDRANDAPVSFHLSLPPRNTNFDLNHRGSVDIGYLPLMQVATEGAERAGASADEARTRLRKSFYAHERIQWRTLEDALARAKENGRRLHVLQLFGTLDDESC